MVRKYAIQKGLAVSGTVLVWLPILAPILFSLFRLIRGGGFHMDILMPAELSPLALVGGILLIVVLVLGRLQGILIPLSLGVAVVMLVGGQALAVVTGLASGEIEGGWALAAVIASLVIYTLAVIALGVGGIRLTRSLFQP